MPDNGGMSQAEQVIVEAAPAALQPLVLCAIWRQTGAAAVPSRVHANTYACLNLVEQGRVCAADGGAWPRRFLAGPLTAPLATSVQGPLRSVSVVFQPWLLRDLFGLAPQSLVDRVEPLPVRAADSGWIEAAAACAPGQAAALWAAVRSALPGGAFEQAHRLRLPVLRTQGVSAAALACGLGERHYRRFFARHMGLAPKAWMRLQRFDALAQGMAAQPSLSALSAQAGYSDQAHMSREVRAVTGHSPARLRDGLAQREPALWSLRPAEVRFVQDGDAALS